MITSAVPIIALAVCLKYPRSFAIGTFPSVVFDVIHESSTFRAVFKSVHIQLSFQKDYITGVIKMKLSNKVYDALKWIAMYFLPALGTLYFALSSIWGLPYGEQVVGTLTALDAFLGALLGISSSGYSGDGALYVNATNEDGAPMQLNPELLDDEGKINLDGKKYLTLKVVE